MVLVSVEDITETDTGCKDRRERAIYQNFDTGYVKKVLSGYEGKLEEIEQRILELCRMQNDTDELIRSLSVQAGDLTGNNPKMKDVSSLILRHKRLTEERKKEIQCEMWRLMEEEETIKRIWACYRALDGEEFWIIRALYVEKQLYAAVEKQSGMSHGKFEKKRSDAMKKIQKLYNSSMDNVSIIAHKAEVM